MSLFSSRSSEFKHLVALAVLFLLTLSLNFSAIAGYWRWDDPSILLHIHRFSFWEDFLSPAVWQVYSPSNLTPWLTFSIELDLISFGLNTSLFYVHHLLSLAAVAIALYLALSLWTRFAFALSGACLFLVGTPGLIIAQQLMTRHYIEGMVFCLAALICFVQHLRHRKTLFIVASAGLYLAAVTAKEVYVPLVVLLAFIPESSFINRLKALFPHLAIAAAYTLWRGYMLGSLGGGYTASENFLTTITVGDVTSAILGFPQLLFGSLWFLFVCLYLVLVVTYVYLTRSTLKVVAITALLILLPMVPLVSFPGITIADRYLFLPWLAVCFSIGFFCDRICLAISQSTRARYARLVYGCLASLMVISLLPGLATQSVVEAYGREYDATGAFIWDRSDDFAFTPSSLVLASYWYVTDLNALKLRLDPRASSPLAIVDPVLHDPVQAELWVFEESCECMANTGQLLPELRQERLSRIDDTAALSLNYEYRDGYFSWNFGPYTSGQYHLVSEQLGLLPAPASGRLRVNVATGTIFYLRYTAPEGWMSYSDPQTIIPDSTRVYWERE